MRETIHRRVSAGSITCWTLDQVDAEHLVCSGVLDLHTRIDLNEEEFLLVAD